MKSAHEDRDKAQETSIMQQALDDLWNLISLADDISALEAWCERVERFWVASMQDGETKTEEEPPGVDSLIPTSARLRGLLLYSLHEEMGDTLSLEDIAVAETVSSSLPLELVLRLAKNFLRWFLQIYLPSMGMSGNTDPIPEWKSLEMLRLYMVLIETLKDPILKQHASQLLFYSSYSPVSGSDASLQTSYRQLLEDDHLLERLLGVLVHSPLDVSLTLSIVRNLHNILVSFTKGVECATKAEVEPPFPVAWAPAQEILTFKTALPLIASWVLLEQEPRFPGGDDDKRAELVVEIIRVCYVLRVVSVGLADDDPLSRMLLALLRLDPAQPRCEESRRSSVTLLMDASGDVVGDFLLANNVVIPLLQILENQVHHVVDKQLVSDAAAALLTPILVVLHKLCTANAEICRTTKTFLFPPEQEEEFRMLQRQELEEHGEARNMSPLLKYSAESLTGRMIQLLTWPQSHIKRFTGELLWVLSGSKPQEYVARVGMGNAVMILGARGLVQIPGQSSE